MADTFPCVEVVADDASAKIVSSENLGRLPQQVSATVPPYVGKAHGPLEEPTIRPSPEMQDQAQHCLGESLMPGGRDDNSRTSNPVLPHSASGAAATSNGWPSTLKSDTADDAFSGLVENSVENEGTNESLVQQSTCEEESAKKQQQKPNFVDTVENMKQDIDDVVRLHLDLEDHIKDQNRNISKLQKSLNYWRTRAENSELCHAPVSQRLFLTAVAAWLLKRYDIYNDDGSRLEKNYIGRIISVRSRPEYVISCSQEKPRTWLRKDPNSVMLPNVFTGEQWHALNTMNLYANLKLHQKQLLMNKHDKPFVCFTETNCLAIAEKCLVPAAPALDLRSNEKCGARVGSQSHLVRIAGSQPSPLANTQLHNKEFIWDAPVESTEVSPREMTKKLILSIAEKVDSSNLEGLQITFI